MAATTGNRKTATANKHLASMDKKMTTTGNKVARPLAKLSAQAKSIDKTLGKVNVTIDALSESVASLAESARASAQAQEQMAATVATSIQTSTEAQGKVLTVVSTASENVSKAAENIGTALKSRDDTPKAISGLKWPLWCLAILFAVTIVVLYHKEPGEAVAQEVANVGREVKSVKHEIANTRKSLDDGVFALSTVGSNIVNKIEVVTTPMANALTISATHAAEQSRKDVAASLEKLKAEHDRIQKELANQKIEADRKANEVLLPPPAPPPVIIERVEEKAPVIGQPNAIATPKRKAQKAFPVEAGAYSKYFSREDVESGRVKFNDDIDLSKVKARLYFLPGDKAMGLEWGEDVPIPLKFPLKPGTRFVRFGSSESFTLYLDED